jgi:hypothetical protein
VDIEVEAVMEAAGEGAAYQLTGFVGRY